MKKYLSELNKFLDTLKQKGYKETTINSYSSSLIDFFTYLHNVDVEYNNFNNSHVKEFIKLLKSKNAPQTVNLKIFAILKFVDYLKKYRNINIFLDINILKTKNKKKLNPIKSIDAILDLIKKETKDKRISIRNQLLIGMIYSCGLRTKDILKIKINDIKNNAINVRNDKIIINNEIKNKINYYIEIIKPNNNDYLFYNFSRAQKYKNKKNHLTEKSVENIFNKYKKIIDSELSIRDLRHSFVLNLEEYFAQLKIEKNYSYTEDKTQLDYLNYIHKKVHNGKSLKN